MAASYLEFDGVHEQQQKRAGAPENSNDATSSRPPKRRRASKACTSCHGRKVRCDLVNGSPCSNCRLDNIQCVERERRFPLRHSKPDRTIQQKPRSYSGTINDKVVAMQLLSPALIEGEPDDPILLPSPSCFLNGVKPDEKLPPYFYPLPNRLEQSDINYLYDRGALTLPDTPLQNALLEAYVEYIHPYMPIIELHPFLNLLHHQDPEAGRTSLLLYQTVMFAATAFVDMKYLAEAGFMTRKEARKFFFNKARLLYDFDYEPNRLMLVQCLCLMTYWHDTADGQKDIWHWIGVAISMGHTIDLQRDPEGRGFSPAECRLRKRVWWSCFTRDRLIALATRKPTKIWEEDSDVPMLEESDFEIKALPESNTIISQDCAVMRDTGLQRQLALMCIAQAKLCQSIGHIVKAQYAQSIDELNKRQSASSTTLSNILLLPYAPLCSRKTLSNELERWKAAVHEECEYRPLTDEDIQPERKSLAVHRTLLHMMYHAALFALHRPWAELQDPTDVRLQEIKEESTIEMRTAAMNITRISYALHQYQLDKLLPAVSVILLVPAAASHIDNLNCPEQEVKDRAAKAFWDCVQVLNELREMFYGADYASVLLGTTLVQKKIDTSSVSDKEIAEFIRQMAATTIT